jgi:hypothetical protein
MLLVFGAPGQLPSQAGQEHGRTIPLASFRNRQLLHCEGHSSAMRATCCSSRQIVPNTTVDVSGYKLNF